MAAPAVPAAPAPPPPPPASAAYTFTMIANNADDAFIFIINGPRPEFNRETSTFRLLDPPNPAAPANLTFTRPSAISAQMRTWLENGIRAYAEKMINRNRGPADRIKPATFTQGLRQCVYHSVRGNTYSKWSNRLTRRFACKECTSKHRPCLIAMACIGNGNVVNFIARRTMVLLPVMPEVVGAEPWRAFPNHRPGNMGHLWRSRILRASERRPRNSRRCGATDGAGDEREDSDVEQDGSESSGSSVGYSTPSSFSDDESDERESDYDEPRAESERDEGSDAQAKSEKDNKSEKQEGEDDQKGSGSEGGGEDKDSDDEDVERVLVMLKKLG